MARENCPRCGKTKHLLNCCPSCGFQRNKQYCKTEINVETKPLKETPGAQLESSKQTQSAVKRKRSIKRGIKKSLDSGSIRLQSNKKSINKSRSKNVGKKKSYGSLTKMIYTKSYEWNYVK